MKKSFAVLALFMAVVLSGTAFVGISLHRTGRNVIFENVYEEGDRQLLEGITVCTQITHDGILSWQTQFSPCTQETKSQLSFDKDGYSDISNGTTYGISFGFADLVYLASVNSSLKEDINEFKASMTGDYEVKRFTFNMKDYFEYYPVNVAAELPGIKIFREYESPIQSFSGEYEAGGISQSCCQNTVAAINSFIRIPVADTETMEYEFKKIGDSFSYASIDSGFQFSSTCAVVDNYCYFSFFNRPVSSDGKFENAVDTSLIPGGYGIYRIPFSEGDIGYDRIENVYPLSSDSSVAELQYDSETGQLYVFLVENGKYVFNAVDEKTMNKVYTAELFDFTDCDYVNSYIYDGFVVFIMNSCNVKVVTKDGKNSESPFTVEIENGDVRWHGATNYPDMYFDGKKLIIFSVDDGWTPEGEEYRSCTLLAKVLTEEDGIAYNGKWHCSLGERKEAGESQPFCTFNYKNSIKISYDS